MQENIARQIILRRFRDTGVPVILAESILEVLVEAGYDQLAKVSHCKQLVAVESVLPHLVERLVEEEKRPSYNQRQCCFGYSRWAVAQYGNRNASKGYELENSLQLIYEKVFLIGRERCGNGT